MKEAIINYINARAEKVRPCKHNWELLNKREMENRFNKYTWTEWTYRCEKCGEKNFIDNQTN